MTAALTATLVTRPVGEEALAEFVQRVSPFAQLLRARPESRAD